MSDKELTPVEETTADADTQATTEASSADKEAQENADKTARKPATRKSKPGKAKPFPVISVVLLLIMLAAASGGYYFWMLFSGTIESLQKNVATSSRQIDSQQEIIQQQAAKLDTQAGNINQILEALNSANAIIETLQQQQKALGKTTEKIFNITHRDQRQWMLAEVSYLLSLANQRVIISSDVQGAIAALKGATNRLSDLADPKLLVVRKQIAREIASLKSLKLADINGITLQLDNMLQEVPQLSFKTPQQQTQQLQEQQQKIELASLDENNFFYNLWERIKSLVTVKKHSAPIKNAIEAINRNEIEQDIQYRLMAARQALIHKNSELFQREAGKALEKLSFYYDDTDNRVVEINKELKLISNTQLVADIPDITGSWKMVQKVIDESALHDLEVETVTGKKQ